ncbi:hypothetical protein [Sulfurospirillum deleyianum]|uniref:Uncharacterized protein n=1 Tax=Sulfurospirillum deleyianum (strain ATCC 51133 / DSM 6946 / 5175) TaxID=525898 RepID=D1B1P7_SULD5|nr:hypothetical protein [Sulfurospirillum deleyianum]ACZ12017.1 hypothetical protein Sdel_0988 [Sulfurospirillum deleyianum DSM 6946]
MATAEFSSSGVTIGYDPTVKESIENQLKTLFPDGLSGDANLADYAVLFASMLLNTEAKIVKVYANGKSLIIDGTTNLISSSGGGEIDDWIRSFSAAGIAGEKRDRLL